MRKYLFFGIFVVLVLSFVLAARIITTSGGASSYNLNEDVGFFYNISINNTGLLATDNITQVNITFPSVFTLNGDAGTGVLGDYSNNGNTLAWVNSSGLIMNLSIASFWFNLTCSTPGTYNISVYTVNSTMEIYSNISVTVNDTTPPEYVQFISPTPDSGTNLSQTTLSLNVSSKDNAGLSMARFYLWNSTGFVNNTNLSISSNISFVKFFGLLGDTYHFNVSVNDTSGNLNWSETRVVLLDSTFPQISYGTGTNASGINDSRNWIYVNVSASDVNEKNITFLLVNSTGAVNSTTFYSSIRVMNWTGLSDGAYSYNVSIYDLADNLNSTPSRTIILDNANPLLSFVFPSNGSYFNYNVSVGVNYSVSDLTLRSCWYSLNSGVSNTSVSCGSNLSLNLSEGLKTVTLWANDSFGRVNISLVSFTPDVTFPLISLGSGTETSGNNFTRTGIYFNVSWTETNFQNITFLLRNLAGIVNQTIFTSPNYAINWTNLQDGTYLYNATITDKAGNRNYTSTVTTILDTTPPRINISFPSNRSYSITGLSFNLSSTDASTYVGSCWYNIGGANKTMTNINGNFNATNSSINESNYLARFYCNDSLGNLNNSESVNFTVDVTPPVITLSSVDSAKYYRFNVTDSSGVDNCSIVLNGNVVAIGSTISKTSTNTIEYSTPDGTYNYLVNCTDSAVNIGKSDLSILTVTSTTNTVVGGGGGGGGSGAARPAVKYNSIKLIVPGDILLSNQNYIQIKISLQNNGQVDLRGINLTSRVVFNDAPTEDVNATFTSAYIPELGSGQSQDLNLNIYANTQKSGRYKATVYANVSSPSFGDWVDFYIELQYANKTDAEHLLAFAETLIMESPKCIELSEMLKEAEQAIQDENYSIAVQKSSEAVEACKKAIGTYQNRYVPSSTSKVFYYVLLSSLFVVILWLVFYVYNKAKLNKVKKNLLGG